MREIKQWAMVFLFLLSTASTAGAWGVEFAIGGWAQEPSGSLGYKALSSDDILDIENDLNYEQENQVTHTSPVREATLSRESAFLQG
jgi:hypothetical protein